eukprot:m.675952 g.675952  ORF g.675952 m.675952 type:complete len:161 (-) comp58555_c0_seq10:5623-6105(-)
MRKGYCHKHKKKKFAFSFNPHLTFSNPLKLPTGEWGCKPAAGSRLRVSGAADLLPQVDQRLVVLRKPPILLVDGIDEFGQCLPHVLAEVSMKSSPSRSANALPSVAEMCLRCTRSDLLATNIMATDGSACALISRSQWASWSKLRASVMSYTSSTPIANL